MSGASNLLRNNEFIECFRESFELKIKGNVAKTRSCNLSRR